MSNASEYVYSLLYSLSELNTILIRIIFKYVIFFFSFFFKFAGPKQTHKKINFIDLICSDEEGEHINGINVFVKHHRHDHGLYGMAEGSLL